MKVLIGGDPHKGSVAVGAIDDATGELLERGSFPQDRAGLRRLERWARRFPERRWAVENAGGLGRHLAVRLVGSGESVVDLLRGWVNKALLVNHQYPLPSVTATVTRGADRNDP